MNLLEFDSAEPIQVPIRIADKWYCLEEASEEAASCYQNVMMEAIDLDMSKIIAVETVDISSAIKGVDLSRITSAGIELLSKCLKEATYHRDGNKFTNIGELVPLDTLKRWKTTVTTPLIAKLLDISELNKGAINPSLPVVLKDTTGG